MIDETGSCCMNQKQGKSLIATISLVDALVVQEKGRQIFVYIVKVPWRLLTIQLQPMEKIPATGKLSC